jgi:hypothetical protein
LSKRWMTSSEGARSFAARQRRSSSVLRSAGSGACWHGVQLAEQCGMRIRREVTLPLAPYAV